MAEQLPCFQLGFDFLNVENSDDFEKSSREVTTKKKKRFSNLTQTEINFWWKHKQKLRRARQIGR